MNNSKNKLNSKIISIFHFYPNACLIQLIKRLSLCFSKRRRRSKEKPSTIKWIMEEEVKSIHISYRVTKKIGNRFERFEQG